MPCAAPVAPAADGLATGSVAGPACAVAAPATPRRALLHPVVDAARCTGCGRCVGACGPHLLSLEVAHWKKSAVLHDGERCTGCRLCERRCPFGAITLQPAGPTAVREPGHTGPPPPASR